MSRAPASALLLLAAVASGADPAVREIPLDVVTQPYSDGVSRITVDWGTQADTIARSPQDVRDEFDHLTAFLKSPEMERYRVERQREAEVIEREQGAKLAAEWRHRYEQVPQLCEVAQRQAVESRTVPAPEWTGNLPWDLRASLAVAAFDASKPEQVAWAVALRERHPSAQIYAVGWTSIKDLHRIGREHPLLQTLVVTSVKDGRKAEQWLADYLITALPAVVTFPDRGHLHIEEGLAP